MKALKEFSLPISGLKNGVHTYGFTVSNDFFKSFEESPIAGGSLEADVEVDIKPGMMVLDMEIEGTVNAVCDRCLADIDLPISGEYRLIVKVGESESEVGEIVYISPDATTFNLAKYIHELVCLSVPISKTYNCEDEKDLPCDLDTLKRLNVSVEEEIEEEKDDPWNVLKDIDLN